MFSIFFFWKYVYSCFTIQVVAVSIFVLASHTMNVSTLVEYSSQVITARSGKAPHLLSAVDATTANIQLDSIPPECLLDYNAIADCMKEAGKDIMGMIPIQVS